MLKRRYGSLAPQVRSIGNASPIEYLKSLNGEDESEILEYEFQGQTYSILVGGYNQKTQSREVEISSKGKKIGNFRIDNDGEIFEQRSSKIRGFRAGYKKVGSPILESLGLKESDQVLTSKDSSVSLGSDDGSDDRSVDEGVTPSDLSDDWPDFDDDLGSFVEDSTPLRLSKLSEVSVGHPDFDRQFDEFFSGDHLQTVATPSSERRGDKEDDFDIDGNSFEDDYRVGVESKAKTSTAAILDDDNPFAKELSPKHAASAASGLVVDKGSSTGLGSFLKRRLSGKLKGYRGLGESQDFSQRSLTRDGGSENDGFSDDSSSIEWRLNPIQEPKSSLLFEDHEATERDLAEKQTLRKLILDRVKKGELISSSELVSCKHLFEGQDQTPLTVAKLLQEDAAKSAEKIGAVYGRDFDKKQLQAVQYYKNCETTQALYDTLFNALRDNKESLNFKVGGEDQNIKDLKNENGILSFNLNGRDFRISQGGAKIEARGVMTGWLGAGGMRTLRLEDSSTIDKLSSVVEALQVPVVKVSTRTAIEEELSFLAQPSPKFSTPAGLGDKEFGLGDVKEDEEDLELYDDLGSLPELEVCLSGLEYGVADPSPLQSFSHHSPSASPQVSSCSTVSGHIIKIAAAKKTMHYNTDRAANVRLDYFQPAAPEFPESSEAIKKIILGKQVQVLTEAKEAFVRGEEMDVGSKKVKVGPYSDEVASELLRLAFTASSLAGGMNSICERGSLCFDENKNFLGWQKDGFVTDFEGQEVDPALVKHSFDKGRDVVTLLLEASSIKDQMTSAGINHENIGSIASNVSVAVQVKSEKCGLRSGREESFDGEVVKDVPLRLTYFQPEAVETVTQDIVADMTKGEFHR